MRAVRVRRFDDKPVLDELPDPRIDRQQAVDDLDNGRIRGRAALVP